jgi:DNA-damage-inducible protein J
MANLTISIDESDKEYISEFCEEIGISVSGLYNMFTKQVIREGRIPFEIAVDRPNRKTIKAMKEGDKLINNPNTKKYTFDELVEEMKKW